VDLRALFRAGAADPDLAPMPTVYGCSLSIYGGNERIAISLPARDLEREREDSCPSA